MDGNWRDEEDLQGKPGSGQVWVWLAVAALATVLLGGLGLALLLFVMSLLRGVVGPML